MINYEIIITGAIGVVSTIISGWASWFFTRKKYNSEVDSNVIENMRQSLEFYKQLSDDNKLRLDSALEDNKRMDAELRELRKVVLNLMNNICVDLTCQVRKRNFNLFNEDGTFSTEKMEEAKLYD